MNEGLTVGCFSIGRLGSLQLECPYVQLSKMICNDFVLTFIRFLIKMLSPTQLALCTCSSPTIDWLHQFQFRMAENLKDWLIGCSLKSHQSSRSYITWRCSSLQLFFGHCHPLSQCMNCILVAICHRWNSSNIWTVSCVSAAEGHQSKQKLEYLLRYENHRHWSLSWIHQQKENGNPNE